LNLTQGQEAALQAIRDLQKAFPDGGGIGVISGPAGTGKTYLLKVIAEEWGDLVILTPTGKAAVRVKELTGNQAMTIHRWQYQPEVDEKTGEVEFVKRPVGSVLIPACGFLVVDESSMVGFDIFKSLYDYAKYLNLNVILVGDGFQLPPVEMEIKKQGFSVFSDSFPANFKVQLTEVLRQALDSPIIRASMQIRTSQWAQDALNDLKWIKPSDLYPEAKGVWENGGATICHKNATRHMVNNGVRSVLQLPEMSLQKGEPLMVIQNNYALEVYNGEIVTVLKQPSIVNKHSMAIRDNFKNASVYLDYFETEIQSPVFGASPAIIADKQVFGQLGDVGGYPVMRAARDLAKETYTDENLVAPPFLHANLGYSLTAHKSQGSEFPDVLVVLENSIRLTSTEGRKWIYVALTRAKERVRLCSLD
jgi:ATP-dependent exoDNAse (exonuclease V) alpha subunit